jgi:hypothetical protein
LKTVTIKTRKQGRALRAPLRDADIRSALISYIAIHDSSAVVFEELPLSRGERRADVVAVNGSIVGYEIKSDCDSLSRLQGQSDHYGHVCEYMAIVVTARHLRHARKIVPERWGIFIAEWSDGGAKIIRKRKSRRNVCLDAESLIRLLWRNECVRVLRNNGIRSERNALVIDLWTQMASLPSKILVNEVRDALKARGGFVSGLS